MKTLFMGSDPIALPLLQVLVRRSAELRVVSQPDKPSGRGQKTSPNDISAWALENNIPLLRPSRLDENFMGELKAFSPDIIFVMAYGRLLKQPIIDFPRLGTWNLHASLLPKLRGASPIETAIATGESETGVALMRMVLALDAGPVGAEVKIPLSPQMTAPVLRQLVSHASAQLVDHEWALIEQANLKVTPQNTSAATYCRILTKADTHLDPAAPAAELERRVRAFAERPGVAFIFAGERLKVFSARALDDKAAAAPGTLLQANERIVISTGQGALELLELQRAGGKRMPARDFLRGYPLQAGQQLHGQLHRPLVAPQPFPRGF